MSADQHLRMDTEEFSLKRREEKRRTTITAFSSSSFFLLWTTPTIVMVVWERIVTRIDDDWKITIIMKVHATA